MNHRTRDNKHASATGAKRSFQSILAQAIRIAGEEFARDFNTIRRRYYLIIVRYVTPRGRFSMRVGILGSGGVGMALGKGFATKGHDVMIGSRSPSKQELKDWLKTTKGKVSTGTLAEAAAHGEVIVLCPVGEAALEVIDLARPINFVGKTVIDVTNPLDFSAGMPPGLFVGTTDSLGEQIQRKIPEANVVKCFNIVGNSLMVDPLIKGEAPDMLIAGNDEGAKKKVTAILHEFGWNSAIDIGGIDGARWLEALAPLWVRLASKLGSFDIAFKVLK